jgi:hypothetical protein
MFSEMGFVVDRIKQSCSYRVIVSTALDVTNARCTHVTQSKAAQHGTLLVQRIRLNISDRGQQSAIIRSRWSSDAIINVLYRCEHTKDARYTK